jgi:hypothetical protein
MKVGASARLLTAVALAIAATASSATGGAGDERVIEGTLVWPETLTLEATAGGERLVVVHDDLGIRYTAQITSSAEIAAPVQAGQRVVVRGLEAFDPGHLVDARLTTPTADVAVPEPADAHVEGTVEAVSGTTLVLRTGDDRLVAIDISEIRLAVRVLLQPGREVGVFGTLRDGAVLVASGLQFDYAPAALPRDQDR